ncbi:hypothetical protein JKP88DRAFT_233845 [Tribonema minus]|uniref:Uncharacterized protein n=1 Tax=Tribonema minus TaxID=303371 RepID=A0A835YVX0_9STRA|nr:hypothetical protein JKP88DRAFT_238715 [Tribonema minus]KAG5182658.1 hypothetical protein JKP88DRAFT_238727 [Tribonema minus]KAG5183816.1 hypothetical protein JKP88DRAFT_238204 [Tribonema minus]KAG5188854.1 hypothetical protein JKP88DRAFT_233845 [Tribonema minus]
MGDAGCCHRMGGAESRVRTAALCKCNARCSRHVASNAVRPSCRLHRSWCPPGPSEKIINCCIRCPCLCICQRVRCEHQAWWRHPRRCNRRCHQHYIDVAPAAPQQPPFFRTPPPQHHQVGRRRGAGNGGAGIERTLPVKLPICRLPDAAKIWPRRPRRRCQTLRPPLRSVASPRKRKR